MASFIDAPDHDWRLPELWRSPTARNFAEYDFRYNCRAALKVSDSERAELLLEAIRGKRLTYPADW